MSFRKAFENSFPRRRSLELHADVLRAFSIKNRVQSLVSYLQFREDFIARRLIAYHCHGVKRHYTSLYCCKCRGFGSSLAVCEKTQIAAENLHAIRTMFRRCSLTQNSRRRLSQAIIDDFTIYTFSALGAPHIENGANV